MRIKLKCTRDDVNGPNEVYNRGYFFLPTKGENNVDIEPNGNTDFKIGNDVVMATVDATSHTITVTYAPNICFTADNVTVVQGARTTGKGNKKQALLRVKVEPQAPCSPTAFSITLTGAQQLDNVKAYLTTADQLNANDSNPQLLGSAEIRTAEDDIDGKYKINVEGKHLMKMGESNYLWIAADIKSTAIESEIIDATIDTIYYQNAANVANSCIVGTKGNPEGNMRIFLKQSYVWVSTENNATDSRYYRNPAILSLVNGTVLAFGEYRYDNVNGLGKDYDGTDYGHRIDVLMRKSTDYGVTWGDTITVAAGTDGSESVPASGYAGPAVAYNGSKVVCLMAKGSSAYDKGLTQAAISTSTDNGTTWTTTDLNINWNGLTAASYYVTPGKGIAYADHHVAFVINAKVGGRTQEYLLYSDATCATWTVDPTPLSGKGKESKLQFNNDSTLLVMGKKPISKDSNNDLLYFKRSGDDNTSYDGILQTAIWKYDGTPQRLKDLRLYVSFDQTTSWQQLFVIQPANAANNSMQKDSEGNLAICFEDGSIGNDEKDGCYALNYVVVSLDMIAQQSANMNTAIIVNANSVSPAPNVSFSGGWVKSVTTNANSGFAGVVISADYGAFDRETYNSKRVFDIRPSAANTSSTITIKAPQGYVIKGYSIKGISRNAVETYTVKAADSTKIVKLNGSEELLVDNIFSPSTTFTFTNSGTYDARNNHALISDFQIILAREEYGVTLHRAQEGVPGKSYATLYTHFDLTQADDNTKAYYITEVTDGQAMLIETRNEGRDIPKKTAVVLINSEGETYVTFTITEGLESVVDSAINRLKGTLTTKTLNLTKGGDNHNYSLGTRQVGESGTPVVGFYQNGIRDFMLGANRAWLDTSVPPAVSGNSRGFDLTFGEATAIEEVEREAPAIVLRQPTDDYYDLHGRKVNGSPHAKGIYVRNGKKIVIH